MGHNAHATPVLAVVAPYNDSKLEIVSFFFETVSRRQHWTRTPLFNAHRSQNKREAQDNTTLNDDAHAQRRPGPKQTDRDGQSRTETNKKRHPNGETQEDHMGNTKGHTREDHSKPYL